MFLGAVMLEKQPRVPRNQQFTGRNYVAYQLNMANETRYGSQCSPAARASAFNFNPAGIDFHVTLRLNLFGFVRNRELDFLPQICCMARDLEQPDWILYCSHQSNTIAAPMNWTRINRSASARAKSLTTPAVSDERKRRHG